MTKKDYEAFAAMIRDNILSHANYQNEYYDGRISGYNEALEDMAYDMSRIFAADNPRFDKKIFIKACGL
jgi:hypothetical protein